MFKETRTHLQLIGIVLACLLTGSVALALQAGQTVDAGIYTEQQAKRGEALYQTRCSTCHGANLAGRTGPPLTGDDFLSNWETQPLLELANKIFKTMPKDDTNPLTPKESADLLAYILQVGKFPSGRADLVLNEAALEKKKKPSEMRFGGSKPETLEIRGAPALLFENEGLITVYWQEQGVGHTVTSSISRRALFKVIEDLL